MWDEENSAETVTIHPWAGVSQPQVWRNGNGAPNSSGTGAPRAWDTMQQGPQNAQLPPPGGGGGWTPQMAWSPMPPPGQPGGANWHIQQPQQQQHQQWGASNSASSFADKVKSMSGNAPRVGMQPSTSIPRFDAVGGATSAAAGGWAAGAVKVDQQTPWDTTGGGAVGPLPPPPPHEWNTPGGVNTRWGQPAAVGLPSVVSNGLWPNGALVNGLPSGTASDWTQNTSLINAAAAMHRGGAMPPQGAGKIPPYDLTGTSHWKANVPPPPPPPPPPAAAAAAAAMMAILPPGSAPAMLPPAAAVAAAAAAANWCQPGIGAGAPPAPDPTRLPFDPSVAPAPSQWVAPHPAEINNDMMWHDPNPKEKKVQRDTGTSIWGDPNVQRGEIRRWKEADQVQDYPAPPSGTDWSDLPLNVSAAHIANNVSFPAAAVTMNPGPMTGGPIANNMNRNVSFNNNGNNKEADGSAHSSPAAMAAAMAVTVGGGGSASGWGDSNAIGPVPTGADTGTGVWAANAAFSSDAAAAAAAAAVATTGWSDIAGSANGKTLTAEEIAHLSKKLIQYQQQRGRQQSQQQQHTVDGGVEVAAANGINAASIIAAMKKNAAYRPATKADAWQWAAKTMDCLRKAREQELYKLMRANGDPNEQSRLYDEIQRMKRDIFDLTAAMFNNENQNNNNNNNGNNGTGNHNTGNNGNNGGSGAGGGPQQVQQAQQSATAAATTDNGQSRLQQWRKTNAAGSGGNSVGAPASVVGSVDSSGGAAAITTESLISAAQSLSISAPVDGDSADKTTGSSDWKSGMLDWSAPSTVGSGDSFDTAGKLHTGNGGLNSFDVPAPAGEDNVDGRGKNIAALLDDGPPEFVPGKKWEWRDPNKVAEDPNATPGTCKPNPLLSLQHTMASANAGFLDAGKGWSNGVDDSTGSLWKTGPPPMAAGGRFMAKPEFVSAPASYYWVLFQMVDMSKQQVQAICNRVGHLLLFMVVGHKVACAKFAESNLTAIVQRLKTEFMIPAQYLKMVSDEEFEKMIRRSYDNDVPITSRWSVAELAPDTGSVAGVLPGSGGAASF